MVATPPSTHVAVALTAIQAGKHVLVEKPLAPTSAGARTLVSAAAEQGVVLMVGHTFEYNPAVRKSATWRKGRSSASYITSTAPG